jgi:acetyl-CoA C-acetyltransferase
MIKNFKKFFSLKNVVIVNGKRTPIGSLNGKLSGFHPSMLGAAAIDSAIFTSKINKEDVEEVIMGNVLSAGMGQAPARQAALRAGLKKSTVCTTVNKVCSSGMKAVMYAAQNIMLGERDIVVAGGFESMSLVPHYAFLRKGHSYGHVQMADGILFDGLTDSFNGKHMGECAEKTGKDLKISRQQMDEYAILSYERALAAIKAGYLQKEMVHLSREVKKGVTEEIKEDEEPLKFMKEKIPTLKPVFDKEGGITAANSSKLNDGGCAMVLMNEDVAKSKGLTPIARIKGFADAEVEPVDFSIAPTSAIQRLLKRNNLKLDDISHFEFNEAFSSVCLANMKLLGLTQDKINLHGGAVSLGHPVGMSGARIILSLINVMQNNNGKLGVAAICNGGGGASSILIERLV